MLITITGKHLDWSLFLIIIDNNFIKKRLQGETLKARSLVVSDLRSETRGSLFVPSCYQYEEVSSLQ